MGYMIREIEAESKFSRELSLATIFRVVPRDEIERVVQEEGVKEVRERKLNMVVVVWLVMAMHLYTRLSMGQVMRKIGQGLRYLWPDPSYRLPRDSALSYRRYQLGVRPLVALFRRLCRPMATPKSEGAFLFGLRLMAIDGTVEDAPDTLENAAVFGRPHGGRGDGAFPQVRGVYLVECGTHGIVDAGFWPCGTDEQVGARRMLRSVEEGMLVMWDRGLHDFDLFQGVQQRQAHALGRLPSYVKPEQVERLSDGTSLVYLRPSDRRRRRRGEQLLVRLITYTLTDPARPGDGQTHRLATTLLDPLAYPALDLVCAYHERWEIELVIDEMDTHQRLAGRPLRSLKPTGVLQELYGLLLAHYAIRFLMHQAALQAHIDPDRLSFVHALHVITAAIPEFQMTAPDQLSQLYTRLLQDINDGRLPQRRLRSYPRLVKRKMSNFNRKRPEHDHWPQPPLPFRQAVALI